MPSRKNLDKTFKTKNEERGLMQMKKFFSEFKKFITRGNVVDLAVGVIVGSAFTAIVTALTKNIFTPLINGLIFLIFGGTTSEPVYTFLVGSAADMDSAIYIDWGAFISAIINFILVALILFLIIRTINRVQEGNTLISKKIKRLKKADRKELKKRGIKLYDIEGIKAYFDEKELAEEKAKQEAEEKARLEAEEAKKHTTEGLLEDIKALLEKQINQK